MKLGGEAVAEVLRNLPNTQWLAKSFNFSVLGFSPFPGSAQPGLRHSRCLQTSFRMRKLWYASRLDEASSLDGQRV